MVSHNAVLPNYCVKCGRPATGVPLKRKFSWHPEWMIVLIFVGLLPFIIGALILSKRMVVQIPLCSSHIERYKGLRLAAIILLLGCVPEMILAGTYLSENLQGLGIFAGFMAMLAGLICLSIYGSLLRPKFIDDNFAYFRNVNINFLGMLPPVPPNIPVR